MQIMIQRYGWWVFTQCILDQWMACCWTDDKPSAKPIMIYIFNAKNQHWFSWITYIFFTLQNLLCNRHVVETLWVLYELSLNGEYVCNPSLSCLLPVLIFCVSVSNLRRLFSQPHGCHIISLDIQQKENKSVNCLNVFIYKSMNKMPRKHKNIWWINFQPQRGAIARGIEMIWAQIMWHTGRAYLCPRLDWCVGCIVFGKSQYKGCPHVR